MTENDGGEVHVDCVVGVWSYMCNDKAKPVRHRFGDRAFQAKPTGAQMVCTAGTNEVFLRKGK